MLKRGKNRPAHAVLLAAARAEHGLAATFGRERTAVAVPRCPFPKCPHNPDPLFCAEHWKQLDSVMRRELLTELRVMRDRGQRTASPKLRELFKQAIVEISVALYRAAGEAAKKKLEPLVKLT